MAHVGGTVPASGTGAGRRAIPGDRSTQPTSGVAAAPDPPPAPGMDGEDRQHEHDTDTHRAEERDPQRQLEVQP
jgi:hypothetical protein